VSVIDTKYIWLVIGSNNGYHVYLKKAFTFSSAVEIMKIKPQKWFEGEGVIWDAVESLVFTMYGAYC